MKNRFKLAVASLLICTVAAAAYAAVLNIITVNNTCNVITVGIGVYQDAVCTLPLTEIAWGDIPKGGQKTFTFWIKNEPGTPDNVYMYYNTTGLPLGFTLTLTENGYPLNPNQPLNMAHGEVDQCIFTLNIATDVACQSYNWYTNFFGTH